MKRKIILSGFLLLISITLMGCMEAMMIYGSIEQTDVNAAVSPGVTKEELSRLKHLAVIFGSEAQVAYGGDITAVVGDNVTLELMKLGFKVSDRQTLKTVLDEQHLQMSGLADVQTAAKIGKILGADAIVTGNVTSGQKYGMGYSASTSTVVSSATLKIIGVEKADVLMIVTINYKKGQKPNKAAEAIAQILKQKLEDPFGKG